MCVPCGCGLVKAALEAIWEKLDSDKSGVVELEEFTEWWIGQVPRVGSSCILTVNATHDGLIPSFHRLPSLSLPVSPVPSLALPTLLRRPPMSRRSWP